MKRGDIRVVPGVCVRPVGDEIVDDLRVDSPAGPMKRRSSVLVTGPGQPGGLFDQRPNFNHVPRPGGFMDVLGQSGG